MEEKISIEGIDHISISVRDMDAAIRFYMNLMYAKLIKKVKMTDCLVAYLELGCGVLLELVENGNRVSCKRVSEGTATGMWHSDLIRWDNGKSILRNMELSWYCH